MEVTENENRVLSPKISGRKRRNTTGTGNFCCVPMCSNSAGRDKTRGEKRSYFLFPWGDDKRMKLWKKSIPRNKWDPKKSERICSDHFVGGKKTNAVGSCGYVPTLFHCVDRAKHNRPGKERTTNAAARARIPLQVITNTPPATNSDNEHAPSDHETMADDSVDSTSDMQVDATPVKSSRAHPGSQPRTVARKLADNFCTPGRPRIAKPQCSEVPVAMWDHDYCSTTTFHGPLTAEDTMILEQQTEIDQLRAEVNALKDRVLSLATIPDKAFHLWTNLPNRAVFDALCRYLRSRGGGDLKYWRGQGTQKHKHFRDSGMRRRPGPGRKLNFEDEMFLVLVRLKTGIHSSQLELLFGISDTLISQIFTTLINFLHVEMKLLFEMPALQTEDGVSEVFSKYGPKLKVVLDCTELQTQKSSDLRARKQLFSNYKQRDTMKFMVGLAPNLCVNFVSKAWGGRASDKTITMNSNELLDALTREGGASVMSDRGFTVGDELSRMGVDLIIPDFKGRDRSQLSEKECYSSENIAQARIHVERIIQRIRTFHILSRTVPLSMKDVMEQVFSVCAYLTNFQLPIVR